MPIVSCPTKPLSRSLDVPISISRPQTEIATDMTMICFVTPWPSTPFFPDNNRVRYYSTLDAVLEDFDTSSQAYFAASAFFSRSERPNTMAIGAAVESPIAATLTGGVADMTKLTNLTDGSFAITVDGQEFEVTGITTDTSPVLAAIANAIDTAINAKGTATVKDGALVISSKTTGDESTISYATAASSGTDISALLMLTDTTAANKYDGYTPGTLADELNLIQTAARCAGRAIFGWVIDAKWRDTEDQKTVADYLAAQDPAYFSACTNAASAYNTADETNIAYYCKNKGYNGVSVIYHDNPQVYPDMSYAALALSVNYALENSTLTMKFKQLDGIEPSPLTETQVSALAARNCNCYVLMGNTSRVIREGTQSADTWFTDSFVNLMNYKEELQVEVFNVFLRNKKVPYTTAGQDLLVSAAAKINNRYTRNGTFADREVETTDNESGVETLPATSISPTLVAQATTSERAARIAPPIAITCYEAGAFHSVSLTVTVYS